MWALDIFSPEVIAAIVVVAGSTTLLPYLIFWFFYRRRRGIFIEPTSLKFFLNNGAIHKYKRVLTLPLGGELYPELKNMSIVKIVEIGAKEEEYILKLKQEYELSDEVAKSVACAQKKKAKKLVMLYDLPDELKQKLKHLEIALTEDETQLKI